MDTASYDDLLKECRSLRLKVAEGEDIRRQLRQSESKIARLLDNMPGMAYRCSISGNYDYVLEFVSRGSTELLGFSPEELVRDKRNTIERKTHPDDLERLRGDIYDAILAHKPYQIMYRVTMSSGEVKWIWDQGEPVFDDQGTPVFLEGILMDISAQKLREIHLQEENERLRQSVSHCCGLGSIIGKSEQMQQVFRLIQKAAKSDTNVIIYGETGTGKDLVARTIHDLSARTGSYVPVNCGAIPEQLMESAFFGHRKGAFTGAAGSQQGYLAAADGGTLFLDELGELNLGLQVKLLRAIESKMYVPVGDTTPRRSNFRIIAATNRDLKEMVKQKTMRSDFFYRVHVLTIHVPPLRERKEDLPLLIEHFLANSSCSGRETFVLSPSVRAAIKNYDWPGNIREFYNFLERYMTFGEINFSDVRQPLEMSLSEDEEQEICGTQALQEAVERVEKAMIVKALEGGRWRRGEAAKMLGVNLRTLQRKMKQYGI